MISLLAALTPLSFKLLLEVVRCCSVCAWQCAHIFWHLFNITLQIGYICIFNFIRQLWMFMFSCAHTHMLVYGWLFVIMMAGWLACLPACCVFGRVCARVCVCACVSLLPGELGFLCSVISAELAEAGRKLHSPPPARKDLLQSRAPLAK